MTISIPLQRSKSGSILPNLSNYKNIILEKRSSLRMNVLDGAIYLGDRKMINKDKYDILEMLILEMNGRNIKPNEAEQSIIMAASERSFNPLKEYLDRLIHQDTNYLDSYLIDICGVIDTPINRIIGRKWLISAVARIAKPGSYVEGALILSGEQGCGKTRFFKTICPDEKYYFGDEIDLGNTQKMSQSISGALIIELAELSSMRKSDIETVKRTLTAQEDIFVPKYSNFNEIRPRMCVFGGSTNDCEFLMDQTGNRRFWCVAVGKINTDKLEKIKEALWAEAYRAYQLGESWVLNDKERKLLDDANKDFEIIDPLAEKLKENIDRYAGKEEWRAIELDEMARALDPTYRAKDWTRITKIMVNKLGFKKTKKELGQIYTKSCLN